MRPLAQQVLGRVDLPTQSTEALDRWALAAGLPDQFVFDGIGWWERVRMALRWDMYELVLWRHVLDDLEPGYRFDRIEVPADRPHIAAVCDALGLAGKMRSPVPATGSPAPEEPAPGAALQAGHTGPTDHHDAQTGAVALPRSERVPPAVPAWSCGGFGAGSCTCLAAGRGPLSVDLRLGALDRRLDDLARRRGVLVVAWAGAFQVLDDGHATRGAIRSWTRRSTSCGGAGSA